MNACNANLQDMKVANLTGFSQLITNSESTIERSKVSLVESLNTIMKRESEPFNPLDYLKKKPFPYMSDRGISNTRLLLQYFHHMNDDNAEKTYLKFRIEFIVKSLNHLEPKTKPVKKSAIYSKGSNGINEYSDALISFISLENSILKDIFPNEAAKRVQLLEYILDSSSDEFSNIVRNLSKYVSTNILGEGLLSFELIEAVNKVIIELRQYTTKNFKTLESGLNSSIEAARSYLCEFMQFIETKTTTLPALPSDSGVCDVTIDVMSRMRRFSEYKDTAVIAIEGMKPGSWIPTNPKPFWVATFSSISPGQVINEDDVLELLSSYCSDSFDALMIGLELKAKTLQKNNSQVGFFLITNLTLIEQLLQQSELGKVLGVVGASRIERLKKRALNLFLQGWKACATYLMDVTMVSGGKPINSKSMSSKDKELIKEKFKNFNTEFDALVANFKTYNITDQALRQYLVREIKFISPLYRRFYDKHSSGDFSKHSTKYIKYDTQKFDQVLDSLTR